MVFTNKHIKNGTNIEMHDGLLTKCKMQWTVLKSLIGVAMEKLLHS